MILFSRFASVSLLLVLAGCQDTAGPLSSTVIGGNLVRLTTSASASELIRGSPVTLHIRVKNEGTEAVTLHFNSTCQVVPFIHDAGRTPVIPDGGAYGCGAALTQLSLAPGESEDSEYVWTGGTAFASQGTLRPLPPGRYYFSARVLAEDGAAMQSEPIELILK